MVWCARLDVDDRSSSRFLRLFLSQRGRVAGSVLNAFRTSGREIWRTATEFERRRSDACEAFERQWMMADRTAQSRIGRPHKDRRRPVFELQIRIEVLPRLQDRAAKGFDVGL